MADWLKSHSATHCGRPFPEMQRVMVLPVVPPICAASGQTYELPLKVQLCVQKPLVKPCASVLQVAVEV